MKKLRSFFLLIGLFAIATMAASAKSHSLESINMVKTPDEGRTIVGSWEIDGFPDLQPNPFKAMGTFSRDGGCITSAHVDSALGATPGYGAWKRSGKQRYAFTFKQLLGGPDESYQGSFKVNADVTLSLTGNEFEGTFAIYIYAPDGTEVFSDTGALSGRRIEVE